MALADLDGDGALDLISAGYGAVGAGLTVQRNDGNGNFDPVQYAAVDGYLNDVSVADLNGDGALDLAVCGTDGVSGRISIFINDGQGSFRAAASLGTDAFNPLALVAADVNGDGAVDLVSNESDGGGVTNVTVRLNDGTGNFSGGDSYAAGPSSRFALGDVNGDGATDLVRSGGSTITVQLNDGNGKFGEAESYPAGGDEVHEVSVFDINGDGALDLLAGVVTS